MKRESRVDLLTWHVLGLCLFGCLLPIALQDFTLVPSTVVFLLNAEVEAANTSIKPPFQWPLP